MYDEPERGRVIIINTDTGAFCAVSGQACAHGAIADEKTSRRRRRIADSAPQHGSSLRPETRRGASFDVVLSASAYRLEAMVGDAETEESSETFV
jgi:hypothetical protein